MPESVPQAATNENVVSPLAISQRIPTIPSGKQDLSQEHNWIESADCVGAPILRLARNGTALREQPGISLSVALNRATARSS
jgi:hypothetical protein